MEARKNVYWNLQSIRISFIPNVKKSVGQADSPIGTQELAIGAIVRLGRLF